IIAGENNSGKSSVIDGIRLLTLPLNGRRERYPEESDVSNINPNGTGFTLSAKYQDLSDEQKGFLISAIPDPTKNEAVFGLRYKKPKVNAGQVRGEDFYFAGKFDENPPESGSSKLIRHVFLPAMRDA